MTLGLNATQIAAVKFQKRHNMAFEILKYASSRGAKGVTCDECAAALNLKSSGPSVRFGELVRSGCLVQTRQRRQTRSGGYGLVHTVAPDADFTRYLVQCQGRKQASGKKLTPCKQAILESGLRFLDAMTKAKRDEKKQSKAVQHLVASLCQARHLSDE